MTQNNNDNTDNKVTIILAIGLIGVAIGVSIGLLYILNILAKQSTTTSTLSSLQSQQPSQLEKIYMQRLETIMNEKGLSDISETDTTIPIITSPF